MAIDIEQFGDSLAKFMPEDKVLEALLAIDEADTGTTAGFQQLERTLSQLGVPPQLWSMAMDVSGDRRQQRQSTIDKEVRSLTGGGQVDLKQGATFEDTVRQHGLDVARQLFPDRAADAQAMGQAMGGVVGDPNQPFVLDDSMIQGIYDVLGQERPEAPKTPDQLEQERLAGLDKQFGHDLSWLDELFQQDPTEALKQAQALGTTADPEVAKQQQALVDEIRGRGLTADQKSRDAQQSVVDELGSIYEQGGQTARDRMLRAKARSESENWLRGQREADMQDLAERGMSGGGAEILSLLGDRQDAASRLSMADLQASADAEERALAALQGKGALAGQMEGSANAYQQGNTAIAGNMLGGMRSAADAFQQNNANIIAQIGQTNKDYLRQAQSDMLKRRDDWNRYVMGQQVDIAKGLMDADQRDNMAGWQQGFGTATQDTGAANAGRQGFNANTVGAFTGQTPGVRAAGAQQTGYTGEAQAHAGQAFSGAANFVGNLFSGLYGGGGGGGNQQTTMQDKNKQGAA